MSTVSSAMRDSTTMLRRDLRHAVRFPLMTLSGVFVPVFFLLLFVGVFGRTLRAGLGVATPVSGHYIDYLAPAVILMTAGSSAEATAVAVCTDMAEGIIARFRTMAIARTSVLTGQVLGGLIRALMSGALVVAVALALGFRPTASPAQWVMATGMFALLSLGLTWLTVAFGLVAKTPAGANSLALIVVVLPFLSSAFVPTAAMPAGEGLVRPEPALHPGDPDPAGAPHRRWHRAQRRPFRCLVRRDRRRRLPAGPLPVQPDPAPLTG